MISELIEIFLDALAAETGAAKNTLLSYKYDLEQFSDYFNHKKISDISKKDLSDYIAYLSKRGYSSKSIHRKSSSLHDFFKFLLTEEIIKDNPSANIDLPKKEKKLPDILSQNEIFKIIEQAKKSNNFSQKRNGTMVALMYASGLRVSELVTLKTSAINIKQKQVFVKGKGNKERIVPVADFVINNILEYLEQREAFLKNRKSDFLFPSIKKVSRNVTRDVFFKSLKKMAIEANIPAEKVHPHILRHSFASFLINHDTGLRSVQKMLGHENISTTQIYTHMLSENLKDIVTKNHPLVEKK